MSATPSSYDTVLDKLDELTLEQLRQLQLQVAAQIAVESESAPDATASSIVSQIQGIQQNISSNTTSLQNRATELLNKIKNQMELITQNNADLSSLESRNNLQMAELNNKKKIVETRNRMLQVSQEKNVFRKKLINVLLALIVGVTVLILIGYMTVGGSSSNVGNRS